MNLLHFMQFIPLSKLKLFFFLFTVCFANHVLIADVERTDELNKRLSIYPPSPDDFVPIIETIGGQLSAIRAHDIDRAYFFYTSKDFRKQTPLKKFTLFVKVNSVLQNNKSISLTDVRIDKGIGYYTGVISSKDGDVRTINYELIYEDEAWRILGMQLSK